jgi:hypothetical protein
VDEVRTEVFGQCRYAKRKKVNVATENTQDNDPDIEAGVRALGANLTHGCGDATLLQLALADLDSCNWSTTHDCIYVPCSKHISEVGERLRKAFHDICQFNTLIKFCEVNGIDPDDPELKPPIVGTYDPREALNATYMFC